MTKRLFHRAFISVALSAAYCATGLASDFPPISAAGHISPEHYPGRTLAWREEFDGTILDPDVWIHENTEVRNGYLILTAHDPANHVHSPWVSTRGKRTFRHGRIDVRALLPGGRGMRSELKLQHGSSGRPVSSGIDTMSVFIGEGRDDTVHGTLHWSHDRETRYESGSFSLPSGTFADLFHVFSIEWDASSIRWLVDGHVYLEQDISAPAFDRFREEFYLHAKLSVIIGRATETPFPRHLVLDYIRVFE